ncbi:MAG: hypothetical protein ACR2IV_18385 [Bryobacteraceae bacterium]
MDATQELPYDIGAHLDLIQYVAWSPGESFDPICRGILHAIVEPEKSAMQRAAEIPASTSVNHPSRGAATLQPVNLKTFDQVELERLRGQLAVYIGSLSRTLVDRAAKKATNWGELYDILAAEVPAGEERKKFLTHRPR